MKNKNESQKFANKLLSILGENRWREMRMVLLVLGLPIFIFLLYLAFR
jgi:hypothetical protein